MTKERGWDGWKGMVGRESVSVTWLKGAWVVKASYRSMCLFVLGASLIDLLLQDLQPQQTASTPSQLRR